MALTTRYIPASVQLPRAPARVLLDAMPDASALLDRDGTIVAINNAWRMFTLDNDGDEKSTGVGVNYLDICLRRQRPAVLTPERSLTACKPSCVATPSSASWSTRARLPPRDAGSCFG